MEGGGEGKRYRAETEDTRVGKKVHRGGQLGAKGEEFRDTWFAVWRRKKGFFFFFFLRV